MTKKKGEEKGKVMTERPIFIICIIIINYINF
jgi:hypothetical protein